MFKCRLFIIVCLVLVGLMLQSSIRVEAAVFADVEKTAADSIEIEAKFQKVSSADFIQLFDLSDQVFSLCYFSFLHSIKAISPIISVELSKEFAHSPPVFIS